MTLTDEQKKLPNNATPGTKKAALGDALAAAEAGASRTGVHVADAAGSAPTKAEFDALLKSLRDAGLIASA